MLFIGSQSLKSIIADELTLVLEKKEGEYTGTTSDSLGMLDETECEDIEFKDSNLSFNFSIYDGYSTMKVYITLTVEGDTMTGYWETEDGSTGSIKLKKEE